jgi:hypothetical protein
MRHDPGPVTGRRAPRKTLLFGASALLLSLALVELCSALAYRLWRDELDPVVAWSEAIDEAGYREFLEKGHDPVTGWHSPRRGTMDDESCLGEKFVQHYDALGARIHPEPAPGPVRIVTVGDSFTQGGEVVDSDTYPAQLERLLGVRVANHGMGGFGPLQAVLTLEQVIDEYPDARVAVLGVMHENIKRLVTSFWPVLNPSTGAHYAFKPYVRGGELHPNPNERPVATLEEFAAMGRRAFETDFFSRGRWSPPYSLSWLRQLDNDHFRFALRSRFFQVTRGSSMGYEAYYESDELRGGLMRVVDRFHRFAVARDLQAVVAFLPRKRDDLHSADLLIDELRGRFADSELRVVAVGHVEDPAVDWDAYNLKPGRCHPSPYGHGVIAGAVAAAIRP